MGLVGFEGADFATSGVAGMLSEAGVGVELTGPRRNRRPPPEPGALMSILKPGLSTAALPVEAGLDSTVSPLEPTRVEGWDDWGVMHRGMDN